MAGEDRAVMPAEGVMTVLIDVTGDDSRVLRID